MLLVFGILSLVSVTFFLLIYIQRLKKEFLFKEKEIRMDAIKNSKATILGQSSEKVIPLFKDFPYNIEDLRFIGSPIDYLVFDGLQEKTFGNKEKKVEIIIAEVKTGNNRMSSRQRAIKEAIKGGRVRFEEWYCKEDKIKIV